MQLNRTHCYKIFLQEITYKNWINNKNMHAKYKFIQIAIGIFSHFPTPLLSKTRYIHLRLNQSLLIRSQSRQIYLYTYKISTGAGKI